MVKLVVLGVELLDIMVVVLVVKHHQVDLVLLQQEQVIQITVVLLLLGMVALGEWCKLEPGGVCKCRYD